MRPTTGHTILAAILVASSASSAAFAQACAEAKAPCLEVHVEVGCDNPGCCKTVCSLDPECCSVAWDQACVAIANESCVGLCGSSVSGPCQTAHASPGCRDEECCDAVCVADPSCCTVTWDATCALIAGGACIGGPPVECGSPEQGSCIAPHENPGCEYAWCCDTVCSVDPSCCSDSWDVICALLGLSYCSGCGVQCPEGTPAPAEACAEREDDLCGSAGQSATLAFPGIGTCGFLDANELGGPQSVDRDVYEVTVVDTNGDGVVNMRVRLASEATAFAAVVRPGCPLALADSLMHVNVSNCAEISASACVPAGTYWLVVMAGSFPSPSTTPVQCTEEAAYTLLVEASQTGCVTPCGPGAGACDNAHASPGCSDAPCCQAVCQVDPPCCTVGWDAGCVSLAATECDFQPPANDGCSTAMQLASGVTHDFNTAAATQVGPPLPANCIGASSSTIGPDAWFEYLADRSGTVSIDTCGSLIDTRVVVYAGTCDALTPIGCSSGSNVCPQQTSARLNFSATCGTRYLIRVGGENAQIAGSCRIRIAANGPICPGYCPADLSRDGSVDGQDLGILLGNWGGLGAGDLNVDLSVDGQDLGILLGAWGPCPPTP